MKRDPNLPFLKEKTDYFIKCCLYIADEYGLKYSLPRNNIELLLYRFSKKVNFVSIGENYIWNYVSFVFSKKLIAGRMNAFKFNWLTSLGSTRIWFDKESDWYFWHGQWLLESKLVKPAERININPRSTEEVFRRKYLNSVKGFATCLENTSLSDPESRFCRMCFKKLDCRKILKENNPQLYISRYGRTE